MKNGDLLWNPYTDSHEDLVALNNLRDNRAGNFVRMEFSPGEPKDLDKPAKYKLKIDEQSEPDWLTADLKEKTIDRLRDIIKRMIVSGPVTCLIGGSYILSKGASIKFTKTARIVAMLENSQVNEMWGNSQVNAMRENSQVNAMWGNSQVNAMRENSQVNEMWGNSKAPRKATKK